MSASETTPIATPFEVSPEEYEDLVSQVDQLTLKEAEEEWIASARYGEIDALQALLAKFPSLLECQEEASGNTALHMASANGHKVVAQFLLERNHPTQKMNQAGNTALHWAAANGHDAIVQKLLESTSDVDVLQKNEFGRSVLTEGFTSQNTQVVKLLLEHDSASEDRLVQAAKTVEEIPDAALKNPTSDDDASSTATTFVLHEFALKANQPNNVVKIRELAIANADNPFGNDPTQDTTGYGIWSASLVMARWMADISSRFQNKTVLELGAGCGVPGLALKCYSNPKHLYLTDLNATTVMNLQHNLELNQNDDTTATVFTMNWNDPDSWPSATLQQTDYVIGSDLIYSIEIVPLLLQVVQKLLKQKTGRFLYVAPESGRQGLDEFLKIMEQHLVSKKLAPKEYYANPLVSQDDEECFMHFHELSSSTYMLYEYRAF